MPKKKRFRAENGSLWGVHTRGEERPGPGTGALAFTQRENTAFAVHLWHLGESKFLNVRTYQPTDSTKEGRKECTRSGCISHQASFSIVTSPKLESIPHSCHSRRGRGIRFCNILVTKGSFEERLRVLAVACPLAELHATLFLEPLRGRIPASTGSACKERAH